MRALYKYSLVSNLPITITVSDTYTNTLTYTKNYKLTTKVDNLVGEFEYYTTNPEEYKTILTYTFEYDEQFTFTLIVHSHKHYQDGEGGDSIQNYVGEWIGSILSTPYFFLESIPTVTEVTDVLTQGTYEHDIYNINYHCLGEVDGKDFVPYEGHPVLV